jgi:eukaryotic-like serine/threonine-protein kinase
VGVARAPDSSERTVVERRDPLLGEVFDQRFRVDAKIAAGGFGAIYRATHLDSQRQFALKMLHRNLTTDPSVVARFKREGAALLRLQDWHTVKAYDIGEAPDGTLYIVMELLHGKSLYDHYREHGPLQWPRMLTIARAVCTSLAEAHGLGIIHRDLKPTNIHLEPDGDGERVKVLDFGIAKILRDSDIDSSDLTNAGEMVGTLDYMSPEQMVGGQCTPASDIYTLGIVMYEMIAGRKPFDDTNSAAAALAAALTLTPERLSSRAQVPADVDRIVMRCLESHHSHRYQTAVELAAALDEMLEGDEVVTLMANAARGSAARVAGFSTTLPGPGPVAAASTEPDRPATPTGFVVPPAAANFDMLRETSLPSLGLKPAPAARPSPAPAPAPFMQDTLLGPLPPMRVVPPSRPRPTPAPPLSVPAVPTNLREAYPEISRPPPSPMRPPTKPPTDDPRATPATGFTLVTRRGPSLRYAMLALAIAIAFAVAYVLVDRL